MSWHDACSLSLGLPRLSTESLVEINRRCMDHFLPGGLFLETSLTWVKFSELAAGMLEEIFWHEKEKWNWNDSLLLGHDLFSGNDVQNFFNNWYISAHINTQELMKLADPDLERHEMKIGNLSAGQRVLSRLLVPILKLKYYKHIISSLP